MVYQYTKPRKPVMAAYSGPGPCYAMPGLIGDTTKHDPRSVHHKAPAYTFGSRSKPWSDSCSPGPAYLIEASLVRVGKEESPKYTMVGRPRIPARFATPAPWDYPYHKRETQSAYRAPAYDFGLKNRSRRREKSPGPADYDTLNKVTLLSGRKNAPGYTIVGKSKTFLDIDQKTPGPNKYAKTDVQVYKSRVPTYTITGKNFAPGDKTEKPGPSQYAAHEVHVVRKSAPKFTFGLRHSQYEAPLILTTDNH